MLDELKKIRGNLDESFDNVVPVLNSSGYMVWISDKKEVIYINDNLRNFIKENKEQSFHSSRLHNIHKDDIKEYTEVLNKAYLQGVSYITEYRLKNSNQEYVWIKEEGIPIIFRGDSSYRGFICGCININAEKKLRVDSSQVKKDTVDFLKRHEMELLFLTQKMEKLPISTHFS